MTKIIQFVSAALALISISVSAFAEEEKTIVAANECRWAISINPGDYALSNNLSLGLQHTIAKKWAIEGSFRVDPFPSSMGKAKLFATANLNFIWWTKQFHKGFWLSFGPQYMYRKFASENSNLKQDVGLAAALGYSFLLSKHFSIDLGVGGWGGAELAVDNYPSWRRYKPDRYGKYFLEWDRAVLGISILF